MRRTRWDQKPEIEEPIASGSRWNSQCPVNWEHHDGPQNAIQSEREHLNTPHPLDYSNDNRQRDHKNANAEINKDKSSSSHRKTASDSITDQNPIHPTHWSYMANMAHIYPGSSQNAQVPYSSHTPWNQMQQGFFSNGEFHRNHIFDMKWWEEQRLPLSAHLSLNEETSKEQQEKLDLLNPWSFGTRVPKHNDRSYDMTRRYARYHTGNYDRNNKDLRNFPPSSTLNARYKFEAYRIDRRPLLSDRDSQTNIWRYGNNGREYPEHSRPQDYSHPYRLNSAMNTNNGGFFRRIPNKFKVPLKHSKEKNPKSLPKLGSAVKKKRKKEKKKDSAAEIAKKKALAAAANKLKKTFLAAKKSTNRKFDKKSKEVAQHNKESVDEDTLHADETLIKSKVQDLSVPKSIPKEGTSLEHDIDIKFSAHEWESVGRGEGGTQNVLDLPTAASKSNKEDLEEINSDSDSVQTIIDDDSVKELTDESESSSEEEEEEEEEEEGGGGEEEEEDTVTWSRECRSPTPLRRRHASETIKIETEAFSNQPKIRRVRSYSTSQVEQIVPEKTTVKSSSFLTSNLKNMLVKQLLSMDKKSLKELVDDPKSRKAQFMMSHFMTMHRSVLSQRLNQLRFKSISSPPSAIEDTNAFHSFNPAHLEDLPPDLLQQVKEILDFEADGKAQQMWEEVSLSLSDLVSGLEGIVEKPRKAVSSSKAPQQSEEEEQQQQEQQRHHHSQSQPSKRVVSRSPPENGAEDLDCQIVTPPPKLPTTTITIPDSDNEIPSDILAQERDRDVRFPPPPPLLITSSLNKNIPPPVSRSSPPPPLEPRGSFIKPRDLTRPPTTPLDQPDRPPNPVPCSPPLSHMLAPPPTPHAMKQSPHPPTPGDPHSLSMRHPSSPFLPPTSPIEAKRLKINIKSKMADDSDHSASREECEINRQAPSSIKVKQERPSPMMECGLCMHPPRSPHTPQCGFAFGIPPPPVALMPGSPRPLGAVPPQRPVPHLASAGVPTIFKQERQAGSYLNLEHVNRPSSEERPKNPAPPDTTSNEPPSPLPIPPPQSTLHQAPPPRPLLFTPEEPPRPPSPPPPQHSPRIKLERQTPQFICCCMRNECERSTSSRQSADFRRSSTTPQGQLCESASLRATPHSVYKFEPPYLAGLRSRTPHNGIVNMFPSMSPSSARCLAPSNASVMQGLLPNQCLGVVNGDAATAPSAPHHSKVTVGVQTVGLSPRQLASSYPLPSLPVTSVPSKMDQTTSTEDLADLLSQSDSPSEDVENGVAADRKPFHVGGGESFNSCSVPTSSVPDDHVAAVLSKFRDFNLAGCSITQLVELNNREREVLVCLDIVERKDRELARERRKLSEVLRRIHEMRYQRLVQHQSSDLRSINNSSLLCKVPDTDVHPDARQHVCTNDDQVVSNSSKIDRELEHETGLHNSSQENQYMVSSSQEIAMEFKSPVSPSEYFSNDSQTHSLQGERCTSTSLVERKENLYQGGKEYSDSEEEEVPTANKYGMKSTRHQQYRLGQTCFMNRNRLNSGSTSDEFQEEKIKEDTSQDVSIHSNNVSGNGTCFDTSSDMDLKKQELLSDSSLVKLRKEGEKEAEDLDFRHNEGTSIVKEEHEHLCNMTPNRKGSLSGSPQSPKMRNSSGSEHGYSLRSRGPPNDLFDFNSDSQLSKDTLISGQEDQLDMTDDKQQQLSHDDTKQDDDQADDELEKEEELDENLSCSSSSRLSDNDNFKKRKRKRKTRYQINKYRKKKDISNIYGDGKQVATSSSTNNLEDLKKEVHSDCSNSEENKKNVNFASFCEEKFTIPPIHLAAVLDIKVVGNLIFTTSVDGTARLFDPASGVVLSTYQNHTDSVTSIQVIGEPQFMVGSPGFQVITGSEDCSIHVYDGKTGVLTNQKDCTEPVRCLDYRWGYLFIGTDGGSGIKWNLKDKKLGEKIQFCGKGITRILSHVEGGRKVLVVGAKTTPIMIRDAMSGLFLRTLEHVQLTMYAAVFEGNLLYTGGTDKNIFVYDYCGGDVKGRLNAQASVSDLLLRDNHLLAVCYDGLVRIFRLPKGDLVNVLQLDSSNTMFICSALFRNKILIGNKNGEVLSCKLPHLPN